MSNKPLSPLPPKGTEYRERWPSLAEATRRNKEMEERNRRFMSNMRPSERPLGRPAPVDVSHQDFITPPPRPDPSLTPQSFPAISLDVNWRHWAALWIAVDVIATAVTVLKLLEGSKF